MECLKASSQKILQNIFKIFSRTFAAGNKIKQFYELLVEDSLRREDVDSLSRENMKNLHEIMQSFRFSNVRIILKIIYFVKCELVSIFIV